MPIAGLAFAELMAERIGLPIFRLTTDANSRCWPGTAPALARGERVR